MKKLSLLIIALFAAPAAADTILLKDGTRLEGVIEGEMDDTSLIRTRYGTLTVKKADIQEILPEEKPAQPAPSPAEVAASTEAPVTVSTAAAAAEHPAVTAAPAMTFTAVSVGTSSVRKIYSENGVVTATQTWSSSGEFLSSEGTLQDGVWKELYPDGKVKTEKAVLGGSYNGPLRTFYPSGALQTEANYLAGRLNGPMITYTEDASPLFEQNFVNGRLHGLVREFNPDASVKSETLYADGSPVASQAPAPAPASPASVIAQAAAATPPPSAYTVKLQSLARGERYAFYYENRYRGHVILDSSFNLTSLSGSLPDGSAVFYGPGGSPEKEFVFSGGGLAELKVFGPGAAAYRYEKDKAIKK
ncbi:MAG: hypothetical protein FD189_1777 [Elusimicrobia bacterium]|nr:MAG: hypothetical protein FD154_1449 [Elusimicrobiota bacterium]KAF0154654.1 MAG: hypothetical protein FD189_1777 [Elusimicrobiota bacterium]